MSEEKFELAPRVVAALAARELTLSAAESCTGGWFSKSIVDVSGASAVFPGGVVSYASEVKAELLGVGRENLDRYTAVSAPVCREMAEGVRRLMHTDLAVSVTGLAGPGGGSEEIPVGRVFIGLADRDATKVYTYRFDGPRDAVRRAAVEEMQRLLLLHIENQGQGDK